jgi:predicted metal-dependent phosphoesterase TrpH
VTDHDTVAGVKEAADAANKLGVRLIPGIEMGSDINGRDIHILGYFVDYESAALIEYLDTLNQNRMVRAREMCANLAGRGIDVTIEDAQAQATGNVMTRAHIARAAVAKGYAHGIGEVFDRYLGNGKPCFVPKFNLTSANVIDAIKAAGGIPVLAHPKLNDADDAIPGLVEQGLAGIEAYCRDHSAADIDRYNRFAAKYGLLVTGGSDCHGPDTPGRFCMGVSGLDEGGLTAFLAAADR